MRFFLSLIALTAALVLVSACSDNGSGGNGGDNRAVTNAANQNSKAETTLAHGPAGAGSVPPISSAHGGPAAAGGGAAAVAVNEKPSLETPELDAKIQKAEAKAKAPGATAADRKAAADAYAARADTYRDAGIPTLYKFALGDYRRALRYDPGNAAAKSKMDEIVSIYQSMGRPVPENGNEP